LANKNIENSILQFQSIPEFASLPRIDGLSKNKLDKLTPKPKRMPLKTQRSTHEDEEEQAKEQPQQKLTQTLCKGQKRDYFYQKTVKSIEELDKYRFEVMQPIHFYIN
jgi:hypothetical protein